jgi:hypothetical protein
VGDKNSCDEVRSLSWRKLKNLQDAFVLVPTGLAILKHDRNYQSLHNHLKLQLPGQWVWVLGISGTGSYKLACIINIICMPCNKFAVWYLIQQIAHVIVNICYFVMFLLHI